MWSSQQLVTVVRRGVPLPEQQPSSALPAGCEAAQGLAARLGTRGSSHKSVFISKSQLLFNGSGSGCYRGREAKMLEGGND